MKFAVVIPSRYASSRFPGKPLVDILGKSMIQRVYENSSKSEIISDVIVATDDSRIENHVKEFGGNVIMTSSEHKSGTDRCTEVVEKFMLQNSKYNYDDVIINVQGDEPFINPEQINAVAECFKDKDVKIATLAKQITDINELISPNVVKVIYDNNDYAIYFSRTPIPFQRGVAHDNWLNNHKYYKHIGIYAYRMSTLLEIARLEASSFEKAESLEQLRWIQNSYKIKIKITDYENIAIDTPEDLNKIKRVDYL
ncbi:MAG: 3-deoxy-manno-octulosonate cytidylyltransferase [Bacteroidota bacterium]|nr:3-deoxy-manno-octulosonate cytidylyltransferase [Bacteroidota bacterium]